MGVSERRAREKARLRAAILDAALAVADAKGWDAVTIRGIAERIEYSAAAIYEHFTSKSEILSELALRGLGSLSDALRFHLKPSAEGSLERLAATTWCWAFDNRMLFQLIHMGGIFEFGTAKTPPQAREVFAIARDAIATAAHTTSHDELDDLTDLLWASLSGLILLTMFERVAGGEQRARGLRDRLISTLKFAWTTTSTAREKDDR